MTRPRTRPAPFALLGATAISLAACSPAPTSPSATHDEITIAAAFYPLEFVASRVGGNNVVVITLAPPGIEPHDIELSPASVRDMRDADVVLYLAEFQPSVDDAVASTGTPSINVGDAVTLMPSFEDDLRYDPHFWLDPTLLAEFGTALSDDMAALDPEHADQYRANAADLADDLGRLNSTITSGLASCERDTILVSHEAFGYFAQRYHLNQVGLAGLDPEAEPSPARLREVRNLAESLGATTVFAETLLDPSVVAAFASDAGLAVATLDPVESVSGVDDYLAVMARNLAALQLGLGCG